MRLTAIVLEQVRAWEKLHLAFGPGITVLVGPNASGKTTVLEAAWYAAALESHRTSSDEHLVRRGQTAGVIRASVARTALAGAEGTEREQKIELEVRTGGRARAKVGGAAVPRRRDVLGILRAAIFAPERVEVVRGEPSDRRRFADQLLVQLQPRYHAVIRDFEKALRQRNALLRDIAAGRSRPTGLEAWDEALAGPGGELAAGRAGAIAALTGAASKAYATVGEGEDLVVSYAPRIQGLDMNAKPAEWSEAILATLAARRSDEMIRGLTLAGPHRDDLTITIGGLPARTHASQGEAWMAAVALVLGAHDAIGSRLGEPSVLLLDDAFNPLDPGRRERLAGALPEGTQVLISAADPAEVPSTLDAERINVVGAGTR